jgi:hypothetical protein
VLFFNSGVTLPDVRYSELGPCDSPFPHCTGYERTLFLPSLPFDCRTLWLDLGSLRGDVRSIPIVSSLDSCCLGVNSDLFPMVTESSIAFQPFPHNS